MPLFQPNLSWFALSIESLLNQTFKDWKLILTLDGCDEKSIAASKIAYELVKDLVVVRGGRVGIAGALNRGLKACDTQFTARMDADDVALPRRLELQYRAMKENPSLVMLGTQIQAIDSEGDVASNIYYRYPVGRSNVLLAGSIINNPIAHPTMMFRTRQIILAGGYRDIRCMEDYDLASRILPLGSIDNLNYLGLQYRIHRHQLSKLHRPARIDLLRSRLRFVRGGSRVNHLFSLLIPVAAILFLLGPKFEENLRICLKRLLARSTKNA